MMTPQIETAGRITRSTASANTARVSSSNDSPDPCEKQGNPGETLLDFFITHLFACEAAEALLAEHGYIHDPLRFGYLGGAHVRTGGRYFEPDDAGRFAIITPIWHGATPSIAGPVDHPELIDAVAWRPENPGKWWFLRGEPGLILGEQAMHDAAAFSGTLALHRTPFDWLRSQCSGAVLLDRAALRRLHGVAAIACGAEEGEALDQALFASVRLPRIVTMEAANV